MATKPVALPYPDTLETIGDHLKTRRLELGLYQKDVAQQLGVKTETVTNWEKNYTSPQLFLIPVGIAFLGYDPVEDDSESWCAPACGVRPSTPTAGCGRLVSMGRKSDVVGNQGRTPAGSG